MPEPPGPEHTTALILAGGLSRRMGQPKAWIHWRGQPLIRHVAQRIGPQTGQHLLNLHPQQEGTLPGWQVVHDLRPGFPGPLAGIETGLLHCSTPWLLIVPCDMPRLPKDLLGRLAQALKPGTRLIAARTTERHFPVVALVHRDVLQPTRAFLDSGQRRLMDWHRRCDGQWCLFPDPMAFSNFNRPEQLQTEP